MFYINLKSLVAVWYSTDVLSVPPRTRFLFLLDPSFEEPGQMQPLFFVCAVPSGQFCSDVLQRSQKLLMILWFCWAAPGNLSSFFFFFLTFLKTVYICDCPKFDYVFWWRYRHSTPPIPRLTLGVVTEKPRPVHLRMGAAFIAQRHCTWTI